MLSWRPGYAILSSEIAFFRDATKEVDVLLATWILVAAKLPEATSGRQITE